MKIAILDLTRHPLPLLSGIRRAGGCIEDWLSQGFSDAKFEIFDIAGEIHQVPSMRNFDALIVSGSERSVYDDISWHGDVSHALHESREMGKPIFGIEYERLSSGDCAKANSHHVQMYLLCNKLLKQMLRGHSIKSSADI